MPQRRNLKKRVRALQQLTGWAYSECLRALQGPPPEMNMLIPKNRETAERWAKAVDQLNALSKEPS